MTSPSPDRLYQEFDDYYRRHRCRWAPENPRRVYNLALKNLYPDYEGRLSPEQFVAAVYDTLGYPGAKNPGLFMTFDPAKYRGPKPLPDHFLSLFARKLQGVAGQFLARVTDQGRAADRDRFVPRPALGMFRSGEVTTPWSPEAAVLPALLSYLDALERAVVRLTYWADLSARQVGGELGVDHKTVGRVHNDAIRKLRRQYGLETDLAA